MLKQYIRPTVIVRNVMRTFGRPSYAIYTNKYEKCRTVKCYAQGEYVKMMAAIKAELIGAGVTDFEVKVYKDGNSSAWNVPAVIVRIPNEQMS
jgi:hypothetical protein